MHTLLGLSSLLLVVLGGTLALFALRHLRGWSPRRDLQLATLAAPVASLAFGIGALHHFAGRVCFLGAPPWDYTLGVALPLGMGAVALGGLGFGAARLALMRRIVATRGMPAGPELQALADRLAGQLGAPRPRVLLCPYTRPLALTCGLVCPTLLLSTWMVERLDRRELEAVVAHELAHAARRDYPVVWLATVLRDAFFYLPTSRAAYLLLQQDKEPACDDLAVAATERPLALASALAKVWEHGADAPRCAGAQALDGGASVQGRIERLLAGSAPQSEPSRPHLLALGVGVPAVAVLVALQVANVAILLAPMGCGPASTLGRLL